MGTAELIRPPKVRRGRETSYEFVPVIFANGKDDDLPGLMAAIENRKVQYDDRIYAAGEPVTIYDRALRLTRQLWIVGPGGSGPPEDEAADWIVARQATPSRKIVIEECILRVDP